MATKTVPTNTKPAAVEEREELPTFEVAERMAQNATAVEMRESDVCDLLDERLFPLERDPQDLKGARMRSSMATTWVHAAEAGRLHHVVNVLGWRPVLAKWLKAGTMSGAWATSPEGYLTRGEKGEDVACLMPRRLADERMRKLAVARSEKARDVSKLRQRTAESLAESGDERAAEQIATARLEVTQFRESKGAGPVANPSDGAAMIPDSEVRS